MYENVGRKIKGVAKVFFWFGIIVSIVGAIICFVYDAAISGFVLLIFGPVSSWIGSLIPYGFGEIVERVTNIDNKIRSGENYYSQGANANAFDSNQGKNVLFGWKCVCGHMNPITADTCVCGRDKYGNQDNGVKQKSEEAKTPLPEADSEMVVCPSCGQAQKKNPFGCIYCHSPFGK